MGVLVVSSVAIIGSFRQHYDQVMTSWLEFSQCGLSITSPRGAPILEEGIPFVRFASDCEDWSDAMVQTVAMHRIMRADFVFAVVPGGYVGRTTCYEIGRVVQASRPIYFSEVPNDLPIDVPVAHVSPATEIARRIRFGLFTPEPLWQGAASRIGRLELDLQGGHFRDV